MQRLYFITMNDGSRWGVPAEIIADNYAKYYASKGEPYQENFDAMIKWFDKDDYEFADWAQNNIDWSDVKEHAIKLESNPTKIDWNDGWVNGDYEYVVREDA